MRIKLRREGMTKQCKLGFSWTMLVFGWWVPLFRMDFKWGIIMLIGAMVLPGLWTGYQYEWNGLLFRFHLGIALNALMAFYYNSIYVADLLQAGYQPVGEEDEEALFLYKLFIEEETLDGET